MDIQGLMIRKSFFAEDGRGSFCKVYSLKNESPLWAGTRFRECFYSESRKGVIRGMHFQLPPFECNKLITVISGRVLDVCFDMRKSSPSYRNVFSAVLDGGDPCVLFIPAGGAHGFLTLSDRAVMLYNTDCEFSPDHDTGIHYRSFGFDWPLETEPVLSGKDKALPPWDEKNNPFGAW